MTSRQYKVYYHNNKIYLNYLNHSLISSAVALGYLSQWNSETCRQEN